MIILLGPDNAGKTTLANLLQLTSVGQESAYTPWKAVAATGYKDYIELLRGKKSNPLDVSTYVPGLALQQNGKIIMDRFFYCEWPYSRIYRKSERTIFNLKQWHNMHLSTLSFNPTVVLATKKANTYSDHVPEELFGPILREYRSILEFHKIDYLEHDMTKPLWTPENLLEIDRVHTAKAQWWLDMAKRGLAGVGNTVNPKAIIIAQDLGPMNYHRIPFEHGPTGFFLSDVIDDGEIPLNSFYLTNWLRGSQEVNVACLTDEVRSLTQGGVRGDVSAILLGREAEATIPILHQYIPRVQIHVVRHPGWVINHSGPKEKPQRLADWMREWKEIWAKILKT